ncbi:MAG TPA: Gfo/Idh/MocA family oxidoreductase [Terriglobales bacterium]|nr:Gfo/Idh/MocA family oxidoreductase [Terriglobales bacterium]
MSEEKIIRVAVIGAGAFGKNHARVYHDLQQAGEPVELVGIVDANLSRAQSLAAQFNTRAFSTIEDLLRNTDVDAASVAVPTTAHLAVAKAIMESGLDALIEKPIASTLAEADELIRVAKQTGRVAQVGHLERFNPAVRATYPLLTVPMFFEVHRLSIFGPRALDVDVVLDLMIHDLDIVLSFVNSPIREIRAVGLPILSPKVDIANVRIEFESGCVANFTASRVSTERVRKVRFFQPRQYVSVDYSRQDVLVFSVNERAGVEALAQMENGAQGPLPLSGAAILAGAGIEISKPAISLQEPLKAELVSFLSAVRSRGKPVVSLQDGRAALDVALQILQHIEKHGQRVGLTALVAHSGVAKLQPE